MKSQPGTVTAGSASAPPRPLRLRVTYWGAVLYALATAVGTLVIVAQAIWAQTVAVALPVSTFWPTAGSSVTINGPTASVVGGGFSSADLFLSGLHLDARLWLAAGHLVQGAVFVALGAAVAVLCSRLLRGDPFGPVLVALALVATAAAFRYGKKLHRDTERLAHDAAALRVDLAFEHGAALQRDAEGLV